ncbi:MAG: GNAT family N-acetyltransferase [Legionella sp.]|uniref:GNAT family N-acetyltransferase n=1 Tax=Legionella sp. TaxID=459 RepID=UPI0039E272FE
MSIDQQKDYSLVVTGPASLDFDAIEQLQQFAFSKIIEKTGTGYLFTAPYYRWKYSAPAGNAKIALLHDKEGLVAVNAMYPLNLLANGEWIQGWQSCDTATHPRGRRKSYFVQCIKALSNEIGEEAIFFGYPNHTSKPGLERCGWSHHSDVRTWFRVLPGRKITGFHFIEQIENFMSEQDAFSRQLAAEGGVTLDRSSAYMNWRYKQHPFHHYEIYGWRENGCLLGLIVLRQARILGKELAIVMETLALYPYVEKKMLLFAAAWGRERKVTHTLLLNNTTRLTAGILSGYVPIFKWALPKRQILMGTASGIRAKQVWDMPWRIQIGDWDGF